MNINLDPIESSILLEELKIIASAITDMDHKSTQVKQWCITLWTAVWGLLAIEEISSWLIGPLYYALVLAIPFGFFVLDVQVKRNQRKFLCRAKELHYWMNESADKSDISSTISKSTVPALRLYDPAGVNTVNNYIQNTVDNHSQEDDYSAKYEKSISVWKSLRESETLKIFYTGLIVITIIGVGVIALGNLREECRPDQADRVQCLKKEISNLEGQLSDIRERAL